MKSQFRFKDRHGYHAALLAAEHTVSQALYALLVEPSLRMKSGIIAGTSSRYEVRAWFREHSGTAWTVLVHKRPGQPDVVIFAGDLSELEKAYRSDSIESAAIVGIVHHVSQAWRSIEATSAKKTPDT